MGKAEGETCTETGIETRPSLLHFRKRKQYDQEQEIAKREAFISQSLFDYFDENKNDQIEKYVPFWNKEQVEANVYGERYNMQDLFNEAGITDYSAYSYRYPVFIDHLFDRIKNRRGWNDVQTSDRNLVGYLFNYLTYQQAEELPFGRWDQIFDDPTLNRTLKDFADQGLNADEYKQSIYSSVYDSLDYSQYHDEFVEEFIEHAQHRKYKGLAAIQEPAIQRAMVKQTIKDTKTLAEVRENILDQNASREAIAEALKYPMSEMEPFQSKEDVDEDILKLVNSQPYLDFDQVDDDVLNRATFQIDDRIKYHKSPEGQAELQEEFDYGHTYGSMPNCVRKALICNLTGKDIVAAYKRAYR